MAIGIKKIFSSFSSGNKWKKYTNAKQYGKNAITHLPKASEITEDFCKQNAHSYRLQYKESLETMKTTSNPTTFFYRYDMAIKKAIGLAYMQEKITIPGESLAREAEKLIETKDTYTTQMIERAIVDIKNDLEALTVPAEISKKLNSFEKRMKKYSDEMTSEHIETIEKTVDALMKQYL